MVRTADGSAGDADGARAAGSASGGDSSVHTADHLRYRRPEPSFVRTIAHALGEASSVLDVGSDAGAVSYAPADRQVTSVDAAAEGLPFADRSFDAALTTFPVAGWTDLQRALGEVRRVTSGPVLVLTRDPGRIPDSWLTEYAPEVVAAEARQYPALDRIADALGGPVETHHLAIPFTCVDGFTEAYYARPERLLDAGVRRATGAWDLVDDVTARRSVAALRTALDTGAWDARHGALRVRPSHVGSLVLLVASPARAT
ncbi:class I SAM-dependent methyltransferase [Curtobacterium sp. ISL-83]|uniref:class I SAM-dependent methyltransferase n=1 Tax=Curtobacterium sp. ISL-83 TaxID=2819145 RepID=UPI001BEAB9A4|nr:methyltransferase domain-containing protein [Curtobacterium sp. ISL-83]MBT2502088.1 methyltransferase domain-containing protein [Curtobacterium sp. ISL-83]